MCAGLVTGSYPPPTLTRRMNGTPALRQVRSSSLQCNEKAAVLHNGPLGQINLTDALPMPPMVTRR